MFFYCSALALNAILYDKIQTLVIYPLQDRFCNGEHSLRI